MRNYRKQYNIDNDTHDIYIQQFQWSLNEYEQGFKDKDRENKVDKIKSEKEKENERREKLLKTDLYTRDY